MTQESNYTRDDQITAYHEAGHAVIACRLGWDIKEITIQRSTYSAGYMKWTDNNEGKPKDERVIFTFAGQVAQNKFLNQQYKDIFKSIKFEGLNKTSDLFKVNDLIAQIMGYRSSMECFDDKKHDMLFNKYYTHTISLVEDNWKYIKRVAQLLLEKKTILGEEMIRIL